MVEYTVKYKTVNAWKWNKLKRVTGDCIDKELKAPTRIFFLHDETRIEIPLENMLFWFSPSRFMCIKKNMETETGQKITTLRD